ncbi:MAG TPA: hypothetical protein PLD25_15885 [Chloroflexota bacterium]|nr:hypothetical protein [Chloroflexota bacterium]HUM69283.1 hypothetical protein [Chloroflexota bacterium]
MNEFIGWYQKRAEARYQSRYERASARLHMADADFNRWQKGL